VSFPMPVTATGRTIEYLFAFTFKARTQPQNNVTGWGILLSRLRDSYPNTLPIEHRRHKDQPDTGGMVLPL